MTGGKKTSQVRENTSVLSVNWRGRSSTMTFAETAPRPRLDFTWVRVRLTSPCIGTPPRRIGQLAFLPGGKWRGGCTSQKGRPFPWRCHPNVAIAGNLIYNVCTAYFFEMGKRAGLPTGQVATVGKRGHICHRCPEGYSPHRMYTYGSHVM